jgi:hypothetical protein
MGQSQNVGAKVIQVFINPNLNLKILRALRSKPFE